MGKPETNPARWERISLPTRTYLMTREEQQNFDPARFTANLERLVAWKIGKAEALQYGLPQ
jgi:hypothetical protein